MTFPKNKIISFDIFQFDIFLKYFTWSFASLGQYLLLKLKKICTRAEQSIPLKDLPPHLYLIFLKILIFLKRFLFL